MIRVAVAVLAVAAALGVHAASSQAADECKSLPICIPVAGPWVAIPPPHGGFATATWRLACPQGVVGGVDARASEPAVAVEFPGLIGSPVNPGITTRGSLLFKGTYAGHAHRATSYQPFIGCIPGGGGGRRTPVAFTAPAPRRQTGHADHGTRRDAPGGRGHARARDARVPARRAPAGGHA